MNNQDVPIEAWNASIKQAQDEYKPFYDEEARYDLGQYKHAQSGLTEEANATNKHYMNQLNSELYDLNDQEGQKGTYASTGRGIRAKTLEDKYNNMFGVNQRHNARSLLENKIKQAYQYGDAALPDANSTLGGFQADLSKYTPQMNSTAPQGKYNPFDLIGRKNAEQKFRAEASARDYWNVMANTQKN